MSRFHFELVTTADAIVIRDLASTNGTLVDGVFVHEAKVAPGQRIRAGRIDFVLEGSQQPGEIEVLSADRYGGLVGSSLVMQRLYARIDRAAASDATALITGESGTGKERVAEELHRHSPRREHPFVVVDCGALPDDLIEAELFGHERGAFTGAVDARAGAFEQAAGGTLFLDEIGELPLDLQPKLLRALESRTIQRLGGRGRKPVDARFIAATNRNLRAEVNQGTFREDLFWRLAVLEINVPSLRDRKEDIPALVQALQAQAGLMSGRPVFDQETLSHLTTLPWRGNVRQLRNLVERTAALGRVELMGEAREPHGGRPVPDAVVRTDLPFREAKELWSAHFDRAYLSTRLIEAEGNVSRLAREASMDRKHLIDLLKKHGLKAGGER